MQRKCDLTGPAGEQLTFEIVEITPELACQMMDETERAGWKNFRRMNPKYEERIKQDISNGRFVFNCVPIVRNAKNCVIDGQKRLMACIDAGKAFWALLITGASTFDRGDENERRTTSQYLRSHGEQNYCILAAALGWLEKIKSGRELTSGTASFPILLDVLNENPSIRESVALIATVKNIGWPTGGFAAIHYFAAKKYNEPNATKFFRSLGDGIGLSENCACRRLRSYIEDNVKSRSKDPATAVMATAIKAFNFWIQSKEIKQLKWCSTGPTASTFPKI